MEMKIRNLRFPAVIGVHEWEQKYTRQFVMQVALEYDAAMAAATVVLPTPPFWLRSATIIRNPVLQYCRNEC